MSTVLSLVLMPLIGFLLNGFVVPKSKNLIAQIVGTSVLFCAFLLALVLFQQIIHQEAPTIVYLFPWIEVGALNVPFEFILDPLSGMMLLVITGIGTLIHFYAGGYMSHEQRTFRFFAYLNLFVFMMLLLVLGNNILVMFIGWEGVGLCSFLLIGYWFEEDKNVIAATKAFLVNRIGDIGFLLGIFLIYKTFGTLSFSELQSIFTKRSLTPDELSNVTLIASCLFLGTCGKSAQLPLYVWLPDAMAGPTPVSALIHAATMVTAGIYMMTRLSFLFYLAPSVMVVIAFIGVATALFAATIALVQTDIKKVLAYSTVSQLGFMVLACGVGAFDAAAFHLLTHACFKALLFLGAGSVIYGMHHEQDMFKMGGLKKYMPITHLVMVIGVLAIIGFPGFSGFFSKDEILWKAFTFPTYGPILWGIAFLAALCTSFYMVRLLALTFYGTARFKENHHHGHGHHDKDHGHGHHEVHETPWHMWAPLLVLAFLSVFIGYIGLPPLLGHMVGMKNFFASYLEPSIIMPNAAPDFWQFLHEEHSHTEEWGLMIFTTIFVFLSAFTALKFYAKGISKDIEHFAKVFARPKSLLKDAYRVDDLYNKVFVKPLMEMAMFLHHVFDVQIIQGIVQGVGRFFLIVAGFSSFRMSGSLNRYLVVFAGGLAVFILFLVG